MAIDHAAGPFAVDCIAAGADDRFHGIRSTEIAVGPGRVVTPAGARA